MIPLRIDLAANIERRLLINYRVDPAVAQSLLPSSLRPQLVDGSAVAGICLLRLGGLRPRWVRPPVGWRAENAAHRIAVEWDDDSGTHVGVFIPERHSASWIPVAVGGRFFPGVHRHARFDVVEEPGRITVGMTAKATSVHADVNLASAWRSSLFPTIDHASAFFRSGSIGWSPSMTGETLQGLELETTRWRVEPGEARSIRSTFFDALPSGSAELDSVLVMRNVPITWKTPTLAAPRGYAAADRERSTYGVAARG